MSQLRVSQQVVKARELDLAGNWGKFTTVTQRWYSGFFLILSSNGNGAISNTFLVTVISILRFKKKPRFCTSHLSFSTTFHFQPPFTFNHLSFSTTFHFQQRFIFNHLSFPVTYLRQSRFYVSRLFTSATFIRQSLFYVGPLYAGHFCGHLTASYKKILSLKSIESSVY